VRLRDRLESHERPVWWFLQQLWDRVAERPLWCSQQAVKNIREETADPNASREDKRQAMEIPSAW